MAIIEVNQLTKEYRLGQNHSVKHSVRQFFGRFRGARVEERPRFKALDDINFSVEEGEVLGVIGTNGAGKSTLLKMLARISVPTSGSVVVRGSVAPLIEVGAGLIPDLTGRENVFLNGSILGMSREAVRQKFDEIVQFAELEQFIDTPIKRYSSGMKVRLGFAIATSVDADILIVDEVLAVGDLAFQRKCFDRMEALIRGQGRTVLLVSHNIRQVERICERVILMDHGGLKMDGGTHEVCNYFYELSDLAIIAQQSKVKRANTSSTGEVDLLELYFETPEGERTDEIEYLSSATLKIKIQTNRDIVQPRLFIGFHTTDFVYITSTVTPTSFAEQALPEGVYELCMEVDSFPLLPGPYAIRLSVDVEDPVKNIFYADNLCHFRVSTSVLQRSSPQCAGGFFELRAGWRVNDVARGPDGRIATQAQVESSS
jgi:lipopolysaccharide transport system ATP-binding protein